MSVEHLWKNKNWINSIIYSGLLKYSLSITVSTWNARTCTLVRKLVWVHPQSQACNLLPGCSCSATGPPGPSAEIPPDIASLFGKLSDRPDAAQRVLINAVPPAHFQKVFVSVGGEKRRGERHVAGEPVYFSSASVACWWCKTTAGDEVRKR